MKIYSLATFLSGAAAVGAIAFAAVTSGGPAFIADMERDALATRDAVGGSGIDISFRLANGWLTRHPSLDGGEELSDTDRARVAAAIARSTGVGGARWKSSGRQGGEDNVAPDQPASLHCQDDVEAILRVRTIRFAEASAEIDSISERVLDEVATALLPCLGSLIAITGHTDSNGDDTANLALSRARADAVRWALVGRGIPADGLRASGKGSEEPLAGLSKEDSANRRIDFSVIEKMPLMPTPIDTPGPG